MSEQHHPLSDRALELVAHRFKLLSDPTRLRLLQQLMYGEKSVNELANAVNSMQANVSKHLAILADGGLVSRRKVGMNIFYRIADPSLFTLCDLVCRSLREREAEMLDQLPASPDARAERADASRTRFDQAAPTWDANPARQRMAEQITEALLARITVHPGMSALDYGCGTGLVTLALQPHVMRIIGMDSSPGMLAVLEDKIRAAGIVNLETRCLDLGTQPAPALRVDLVVSAMALHHIADVPRVLSALAQCLAPGGYLALADLDAEDGSFHEDHTGVYHAGFERDWLMAQLATLGFTGLNAGTAHVLERPAADGVQRYPIFLICGQKAF